LPPLFCSPPARRDFRALSRQRKRARCWRQKRRYGACWRAALRASAVTQRVFSMPPSAGVAQPRLLPAPAMPAFVFRGAFIDDY